MTEGWPSGARDFVQALADTKLLLSHRYAQWMLAAPILEDDIAGASAAQDELGHVRQLFRLLSDQGCGQDWLEGDRSAAEFANAATLDEPMTDWTEFLVTMNLTERAVWYLLDAIDHGDFEGLVDRIGQDEYFHLDYLDARLATAATDSPDRVSEIVSDILPAILSFLGPASHDDGADPLRAAGFTDISVKEIRDAYREHYQDDLGDTEVSLDGVSWGVPDTAEWDQSRRRVGGGGIDERTLRQLSGVESEEYVIH